MPLLPNAGDASFILTDLLNTRVWKRLFKRLSTRTLSLLSRLLFLIGCRWGAKLGCRQSQKETSIKRYREDTASPPEYPRTYTIIRDGQMVPLDNIEASSYPFAGGSIRRNPSRTSLVDHPRTGPPSAANSIRDVPTPSPMASQIELTDIPPPARNPQRQYSEVPGINVEYDGRHRAQSLGSPIIEEYSPQELDQLPTLTFEPDRFLNIPGPVSSAVSTYSHQSSNKSGSRASGRSANTSTMRSWDLEPSFPEETAKNLRYKQKTKM